MTNMKDTKLVRTSIDGDPHTLVLRRQAADRAGFAGLYDRIPADPNDALAVTYQESSRFLHGWHVPTPGRPRNVGVVSVGEQMRSAATATATPTGHTTIRGVSDPTDTESIRERVEQCLAAWPADGQTAVYFDSVTDLVERVGVETTTEFVRELCRALDDHDATGYFCLSPDAHEQPITREIAVQFDTVIECTEGGDDANSHPSVSECFEAIADSRRRHVVAELTEYGEVSVTDVAGRVADDESIDRERAMVSLMHVHLPKLSDLGFVTYDPDRQVVARGEHLDRLDPYLQKALEH